MSIDIEFEKGMYGKKAIVKAPWQDFFLELLLEREVKELELNDGKGWKGENVDFLQLLPDLRSITIIDFNVKSIDAIHYLNKLVEIELSTYCKKPINFDYFPELIICRFEWIKGSDSLFKKSNIKKLFINNYDKKTSESFSKLIKLEELSILNSPIENLQGLALLKSLKYLRLANLKKINSVIGIENLLQLEELEIQRCKGITKIFEVFNLVKLKRLLLVDIGNVKSIKGIENLTELEDFLFYESTNIIDGDLSGILKLKQLSKISFQNRKHYTQKREDFGKLYFGQ